MTDEINSLILDSIAYSASVLVIDDEEAIRQVLSSALKDEGYHVNSVADGLAGLEWLQTHSADVVLLDIWMPQQDGLEVLQQIKQRWSDQIVIMMSGHGTIETAVKATKAGAFDFLEKPLSLERLLVLLKNALSVRGLSLENQALRKQIQKKQVWLGQSRPIRELQELISRVAPTRGSVLITGENGTGKELVAHRIHALSPRFQKAMIEVNCAAIPEDLIESELFGHEKGAFTGASQLRRGRFDLADGGTLFLDEIGDMSLKTQAKILRILQEQKFERVGGSETLSVDVRVIAATNKDLRQEIQKGQFREDLYYRLNVVSLEVPPLRERGEDISLLAYYFLEEFAQSYGHSPRKLTEEALMALKSYSWPGNVRELRNLMERLMILSSPTDKGKEWSLADLAKHLRLTSKDEGKDHRVDAEAVPQAEVEAGGSRNLRDARQEFEKDLILKTLKEENWNISQAAQVLGIERTHLHRKIKAFGILEEGSDGSFSS